MRPRELGPAESFGFWAPLGSQFSGVNGALTGEYSAWHRSIAAEFFVFAFRAFMAESQLHVFTWIGFVDLESNLDLE
jgi:hypothetical protein